MKFRWFILLVLFTLLLGSSVACGPECPEGQTKCGELCVNTQTNRNHCGKCGTACESGLVCNAGKCEVTCQKGLTECGGTCINTKIDIKNCGECGTECKSGEICTAGKCEPNCPDGQKYCDGQCANVDTDEKNCGKCGNACKDGQTCNSGKCEVSCPKELTGCGNTCVNTQSSREHCGGCDKKCASGQVCDTGKCKATCQKDRTDCNGSCADVKTDLQHCGKCGNACKGGEICKAGTCELICGKNYEKCSDSCVDTKTSRAHCGKCGVTCKDGEICNAGKCELKCPKGMIDCKGKCVNVKNDVKHCGACDAACSTGKVCDAGKCKAFCQTGFSDCNNSCTNTQTDFFNCGQCGNKCRTNGTCKAGKCISSCAKDEETCGGVCTKLKTNIQHCGACGKACGTGEACIASKCTPCSDCANWVTKIGAYNSESTFTLTVDAQGYVYAAGIFYDFTLLGLDSFKSKGKADLYVVKMSPAGRIIWATVAGGTGNDVANGIGLDKNGNIYISGFFEDTATFGSTSIKSAGSSDIFLAQLSKDGKFNWVKSFGGTSPDRANNMAVDDAGNSYVTGYIRDKVVFGKTTLTSKGSTDAFVTKLDNTGKVIWAVQIGGTSTDSVTNIKLDKNGNLYVTGYFSSSFTWGTSNLSAKGSADIFVAKLDPKGQALWAATAGGTSPETGSALILDASGNIYITGYSGSANLEFDKIKLKTYGGDDAFVAKLDPAGKWLWAINMGGSNDESGAAIGVDSKGIVYATGTFEKQGQFGKAKLTAKSDKADIYLAQIMPDGKLFGITSMGGEDDDYSNTLAIDPKDNIYIGGSFNKVSYFGKLSLLTSGSDDAFVAKYAKPTKPFCPATGGVCNGVCIDLSKDTDNCGKCGNKCGTGLICGGGVCKACTDCPQVYIGGTSQTSGSKGSGEAVTTDAAGNIYYTGSFEKDITFGKTKLVALGSTDIFVVKTDKAGKVIWAKSFGSPSKDAGHGIAVDKSGNVYITGYYGTKGATIAVGIQQIKSQGGADIFVIKLDKNGNPLWGATAGGTNDDYSYGMGLDASDNIYIAGYSSGTASFGILQTTSNGDADIIVAKLNSKTGAWLWAKNFGGTGRDYTRAVHVDSAGNVYITGETRSKALKFGLLTANTSSNNSSFYYDLFVAKIDKNGAPLWAVADGGSSDQSAYSIAADKTGNVYIAGKIRGSSVTLGAVKLAATNGNDIFVAKLDATGKWLWGKAFGRGGYSDEAYGVGVSSTGYVYVAGVFYQDITIGQFAFKTTSSYRPVLIKLDSLGNVLSAIHADTDAYTNNVTSMYVDAKGNSYITGKSNSKILKFSLNSYPKGTDATPSPFMVSFSTTPCPLFGGYNVCGEFCVNLQKDKNHCGSCNNKCANGTTCLAGACK